MLVSQSVKKHRKICAKGNDVITNVICASQHFASTFSRDVLQGGEELSVMASEAQILQPIVGVAFVYCRIDYELDLSNRHAIVLQTW